MTRRSLALAIAGGLAGLAIIGLGVVGWRYSDLILVMPGPSSLHEQRVLDSGEDWVRLSRDDESVQPGTWALEWEDGYGWIDALRSSDDSSVVRDYRPTRGRLPVGGWVSVRGVAKVADPTMLLGLPFQNVHYRGPLGSYPAWFLPGTDSTWVIAVHGRGATRAEALRTVATLTGRGPPMLVITYRNDTGAPRSPDGYSHLGETEWLDLEAAVRHARSHGARRVVLFGYSMGGQVVLQLLRHSDARHDVAGAVLESPMLDWSAGLAHRSRVLGVPTILTTLARWIASLRAGLDWKALDQVRDTRPVGVPILLFHGSRDRYAPLSVSEAFARAHPDEVTFVRYSTGNHVEAWNVDPSAYATTLERWLVGHGLVAARR